MRLASALPAPAGLGPADRAAGIAGLAPVRSATATITALGRWAVEHRHLLPREAVVVAVLAHEEAGWSPVADAEAAETFAVGCARWCRRSSIPEPAGLALGVWTYLRFLHATGAPVVDPATLAPAVLEQATRSVGRHPAGSARALAAGGRPGAGA